MIIEQAPPTVTRVEDLDPGDVFVWDGNVYILTDETDEVVPAGAVMAVRVTVGHIVYLPGETPIRACPNAVLRY